MNEVLNSGVLNLASSAVSVVILVVGLILRFFVNRASSRTNEQIELLEALSDQQKRRNALLRRLCEANGPERAAEPATVTAKDKDDDIIRLVAERQKRYDRMRVCCLCSQMFHPVTNVPDYLLLYMLCN